MMRVRYIRFFIFSICKIIRLASLRPYRAFSFTKFVCISLVFLDLLLLALSLAVVAVSFDLLWLLRSTIIVSSKTILNYCKVALLDHKLY